MTTSRVGIFFTGCMVDGDATAVVDDGDGVVGDAP